MFPKNRRRVDEDKRCVEGGRGAVRVCMIEPVKRGRCERNTAVQRQLHVVPAQKGDQCNNLPVVTLVFAHNSIHGWFEPTVNVHAFWQSRHHTADEQAMRLRDVGLYSVKQRRGRITRRYGKKADDGVATTNRRRWRKLTLCTKNELCATIR